MKVKRAYSFRFYPDKWQETLLAQTFGCVRYVYNNLLRYRTDAYYQAQESVPLQQCLQHQQAAFKNFFEGRAKYPVFKSKKHRQSAEFTYRAFTFKYGELKLAKCEKPLAIKWSQPLPKDLFVTSNGFKSGNSRHTVEYATKLAKYQRRLAKKTLGSKNRLKAKHKVARIHAKISDCRSDNLHKLSRRLVNENQVICAENLAVKNMLKNPTLAKYIADASWGKFTRQLEYKSAWSGRTYVETGRFFPSSKRCACCGFVKDKLPLDVRVWECPECSTTHDRDINAAQNILAVGLAVLAFGENVSGDSISVLSSCSR